MKKRIKETISELKKVSWPSFKDVVKKTGVVLAVVIFFGIVLWIFDFALNIIYKLLQGQPPF
ncbi:MAG: preprotein translocase subunit SecE [Clostridia bacterium]|nr:preprotein translocase subunit SecE [Clostridia bacterium]